MDNPNPIYYRDLITPDDSITKLIEQLGELISTYDTAKSKIQGAAQQVTQNMQGVSGATEEQRKQIQLLTEQSDKLVAEYRDVTTAQWKATQAFAEANAAKKESAQIDKLITQINTSAEGSYNRLSAQYRLNKIRLNEMSAEERKATEAGKQLEAETNAIYEEMKALQEATGKHQLNVGNYADASKGLKLELRELTLQMAQMKLAGEENSEEYKTMAFRAGQLKDAMTDASNEVNKMASDTQALDATMGAATLAKGGVGAYVGAMNALGANSDDANDAQKTLGATTGTLIGITAAANQLQKESALMTGISVIQTKALAKAEAYERLVKIKGTAATKGATLAQTIFNAVAAANPYVLLAMALITVVGALAAFAAGADKSAKNQKKLNEQESIHLDLMERTIEVSNRRYNEQETNLKRRLDLAKAEDKSLEETQQIEDELYKVQKQRNNENRSFYAREIKDLDANREKLSKLKDMLDEVNLSDKKKVRVDVDLDGKIDKVKAEDAIDAIQGQIDNLERKIEIGVELTEESIAKTEQDILRQTQSQRISLIQDAYQRERQTIITNYNNQIEDIKKRLKDEQNLTATARKALNQQIKMLQEQGNRELKALNNEYFQINLESIRATEDMELEVMAEGAEKRRKELDITYKRQIEDLDNQLRTQTELTDRQTEEMWKQRMLIQQKYSQEMKKLDAQIAEQGLNAEIVGLQLRLDALQEGTQEEIDLRIEMLGKQRELELAANAQLAEDVRQSEADINAKWDAVILKQTSEMVQKRAMMIFDAQQELNATEFALIDTNERKKTEFQLAQEKARLEKILELDKTAGVKMTETERQTIVNTIAAIEKETARLPYNNLYELLGINLDSDQQDALNTAIGSVKDSISSIVDSWNAAADAAVNAADKQVEAAQKTLDAELAAREKGYASNVELAQKELELARKNQEKALKEKEKAQQAQLRIDTVTQASSLVTASANIWAALGGIPYVGPALAIAAIATMWGTFAAAKVKAAQVAGQSEQYGEGTVELLDGGSHASGNDIDLGYNKKTRRRRRAEGGEFFAVINKRNSRKFRDVIPDVINSFNDGTFADKYQKANALMNGYAVNMIGSGTDISKLERDVTAIRKQGDEVRYIDNEGRVVVKYKNLTTIMK